MRHKILPGPQTFFLRGGGLPAAAVRGLPVCTVVSVVQPVPEVEGIAVWWSIKSLDSWVRIAL